MSGSGNSSPHDTLNTPSQTTHADALRIPAVGDPIR
jgi:hypothetical protein